MLDPYSNTPFKNSGRSTLLFFPSFRFPALAATPGPFVAAVATVVVVIVSVDDLLESWSLNILSISNNFIIFTYEGLEGILLDSCSFSAKRKGITNVTYYTLIVLCSYAISSLKKANCLQIWNAIDISLSFAWPGLSNQNWWTTTRSIFRNYLFLFSWMRSLRAPFTWFLFKCCC